jgi:hypothetical protein
MSTAAKYARSSKRRLLNWSFFVLSALIAGAFGVIVIRWGSGNTSESRQFAQMDEFRAWVALTSVLLMIAVIVTAWAWSDFQRIARDAGRASVVIAVVVYVFIGMAAILGPAWVGGTLASPLYLSSWRILILSVLVLAAGGGCFCGLMLLASLLHEEDHSANFDPTTSGKIIEELLQMRSELRRFWRGAALLIAFVVIVAGGLRNALNAYVESYTPSFGPIPATGLLLYGAFFALLLAVVSLPGYVAWQARVRDLRDRLHPIPDDGRPSPEWYLARSNLEALLELRAGSGERLVAILGIIAPFVLSIVAAFVPTVRGG